MNTWHPLFLVFWYTIIIASANVFLENTFVLFKKTAEIWHSNWASVGAKVYTNRLINHTSENRKMWELSQNTQRQKWWINASQNRWEGKRGSGGEVGGWGGRKRGRKSTSNHKFNLVSILMSTELKCQQKCSHTWKTFNAFWTLVFFPSRFSQIHLIRQMREVCRRLRNGTILSLRQLKFVGSDKDASLSSASWSSLRFSSVFVTPALHSFSLFFQI